MAPEERGVCVTKSESNEVTLLLLAWQRGDRTAVEKLMPLIYNELRRLAGAHMRREDPGRTLQATALVHEACLRLVGHARATYRDRAHFLAVASQAMRRILVDDARGRKYKKRGGTMTRVPLHEIAAVSPEPSGELVGLDEALTRLGEVDPRKSRVVELRVFGGLSIPETAEVLQVSTATVINDYRFAKAWLYRHMKKARLPVKPR